ncbi:hypothetical protein H9L05_19305 [Hymenobacter qilianensis]|uniref:Discoidin domain-containing protein n=1 Tax=Hymenobacter qilianensis TaxID=1385715 RepID=A0A7H0GUQ5_9BACT|nr:hypothetical protein [Hymenobacter qilianensis]QNP52021.1 hypothetical protein H9L05_19305 [Hymenobacter qilianensis]
MRLPASLLFTGFLLALAPLACSQQTPETPSSTRPGGPSAIPVQSATPALLETFETGSKGAYAEADEILPSGSWHFTDAMIGSAPTDHKNGTRAVRLRGRGRLRMNFDAPAGIKSVRISSATYGDDAPSTWELWISQDGGRQYQRAGAAVRTSGPRLTLSTFGVSPGANCGWRSAKQMAATPASTSMILLCLRRPALLRRQWHLLLCPRPARRPALPSWSAATTIWPSATPAALPAA